MAWAQADQERFGTEHLGGDPGRPQRALHRRRPLKIAPTTFEQWLAAQQPSATAS
jgi:hypothetical protein